jgi:hypothetical protein
LPAFRALALELVLHGCCNHATDLRPDVHDFDAADFLGALVADGQLELAVDGAGPPTASACD